MFLYLLENKIIGKYYIGVSHDLKKRVIYHNTKNSHFSGKQKGLWELVNYKEFQSDEKARVEELRLKRAKNKKYILWYFSKKVK